MYQNGALDSVVKKKRFSRSSEVDRLKIEGHLGSFGVKIKLFKARQFIYKNDALAHVIWKKDDFLRSPEVT